MSDTEPQIAEGKVLWHFLMSPAGAVRFLNCGMDWGTGLHSECIETTDAVLGGQDSSDSRPYGGAWHGPIFVLTHHPKDAEPADGVTCLNCDMDWMTGLHSECIETTDAVLGGQDSSDSRPYGGAWHGPIFVLTHHPKDAEPAAGSAGGLSGSYPRRFAYYWRSV